MSNLEVNKGDEFIFGLDVSASMQATDTDGGLTRIKAALETFKTFATEAAKFDPDGISLYLFGVKVQAFPNITPDQFAAKLAGVESQREGGTMTHLVIKAAYDEHAKKGSKQTFLLLFTDGEPTDPDATQKAIIDIANAVKDPMEFRIAFITVGERDPVLNAYLTQLDDGLKAAGAKHDIVDVKDIREVDFMAALDGALND
jgi:hypothetical protein